MINLRAELDLLLSGRQEWPACLFFRSADVQRFDACIAALLGQGQSLALSASTEAALDHYGELLVRRLRQHADCQVEAYFPTSTAALVSRFDDMLSSLSVQQAMQAPGRAAPARIWLVHEAGALADGELQLLARLVGNFPGAGVRVVLLFGPGSASQRAFDGLGRHFSRWAIQSPSPEEARLMLARSLEDGAQPLVSGLLSELGLDRRALNATELDPPAVSPVAEVVTAAPVPAPRAGWRRWLRLGARPHADHAGRQQVTDVVAKRDARRSGGASLNDSLRLLGVGLSQVLRALALRLWAWRPGARQPAPRPSEKVSRSHPGPRP